MVARGVKVLGEIGDGWKMAGYWLELARTVAGCVEREMTEKMGLEFCLQIFDLSNTWLSFYLAK